jgi:hypothetical protein
MTGPVSMSSQQDITALADKIVTNLRRRGRY